MLSALIWLTVSTYASAQGPATCHDRANTELEKLYCEVKATSPSTSLPNFNEFKRNPPKTQRLLLKRPAKKLGLTLPEAPLSKKEKRRAGRKTETEPSLGLEDYCSLGTATIQCDDRQFKLLSNLPNHKLRQGALEQADTLSFKAFEGDKGNKDEVIAYLKGVYTLYIGHMIDIGLAATTMSFTKFYHTFMEVESDKVRFSARLNEMFKYLKKDKASMGVKSRFNSQLPESLTNCMALNEQLIVCDNVKQNWVYVKP